jgi:serine/threonine protein phosphatase PrpC
MWKKRRLPHQQLQPLVKKKQTNAVMDKHVATGNSSRKEQAVGGAVGAGVVRKGIYPLQLQSELLRSCNNNEEKDANQEQDRFLFSMNVSGITDPGKEGKVNQDTFFTLCDPKKKAMVLGVFDGHGKETGRDAALTAKSFFEAQFHGYKKEDFEELEREPQRIMEKMYADCHDAIKGVFRHQYERKGYLVEEETPGDFLVRRSSNLHDPSVCIRGGTTATVVIILNGGKKLIVSNVGDSSALLGMTDKHLRKEDVIISQETTPEEELNDLEGKVAEMKITNHKEEKEDNMSDDSFSTPRIVSENTNILMLTGDHSPENDVEYLHARSIRPCDYNCNVPKLQFLYDAVSQRRCRRHIYFTGSDGKPVRNPTGDYYKNVRDEWASVVATPITSRFPDSLAFTRSLGDFHMHAYGVSCKPTVTELNLHDIMLRELDHFNQNESFSMMLVIASDGVWDTWKYEDLFKQLFSSRDVVMATTGCPENSPTLAQALAGTLMDANCKRSRVVFGDNVDNMTAIICHIAVTKKN